MTEMTPPDRMHAISPETRAVVDDVLEYARRRALYEDIPLDKPLRPSDLARLAPRTVTPEGIGARRDWRRESWPERLASTSCSLRRP